MGERSSAEGEPGPVEGATTKLADWLTATTGMPVAVCPPSSSGTDEPALCAWPIELLPEQEARQVGPKPPFRCLVRYLVTALGAENPAARLLDRVMVAAIRTGEQQVRVAPLPPELWLALGARPRPALLFDVSVQVVRVTPKPTVVRMPLQVRDMPVRRLRGRVIGPRDVPMVDVKVEVAATGAFTHTNSSGEFAFGSVPAQDPTRLRITGKGRRLVTDVDSSQADAPVVVRFNLEEV